MARPRPQREEGPFSGAWTLLNVTATWPDLTKLGRRPFPTPRRRGSRAAVSGAREAVRSQVRPTAGASQAWRPPGGSPAALLLGIVHPAVLGGSLLPAQGQLVLAVRVVQARIAQGCHGGRGGAGSPVQSAARCQDSRPETHSRFNRALRASRPKRSRLRTTPPRAAQSIR